MGIQSFPGQSRGPPRQGIQPNWTPMAPSIHDPAELEDELHEMTLADWIDSHPHFLPTIGGIFEDIMMECIARFFVESRIIEIFQALATWVNIQPQLVDKQKYPSWLQEINQAMHRTISIGTPNTDAHGNPLRIVDNVKWDSASLHLEAVEDLRSRLEHNHQVHVTAGRAHWDPDSHSTWTQFGIAKPTGYNPDGTPYDQYNFTPHNQWGGDLYGQPGHPDQMIAGGHSETGRGLFSLFTGVLKATGKAGATAAL